MFRRRKDRASGVDEVDAELAAASGQYDDDDEVDELDDALDDDLDEPGPGTSQARTTGPYDEADAPDDGQLRLDLGSLRVPGRDGVDIQVNIDEATGLVMAVTAVVGESALQLQAFAAPRNEDIWPDVRRELAAEITKDGGLADVDEGEGGSLRARLPVPQPDGTTALAPVRFVGMVGPRWLLRGVLSGTAAADPAAAAPLLDLFRGVVVVRGSEAFAPREPLPLRLPADLPPADSTDDPEAEPLDISGTGQHITEIR